MRKISKKMSLQDFAIAVAEALKEKDIDVVLTGGAVVSIYSEGKYVSKDADFLSETDHQSIKETMLDLGFKNIGKYYGSIFIGSVGHRFLKSNFFITTNVAKFETSP